MFGLSNDKNCEKFWSDYSKCMNKVKDNTIIGNLEIKGIKENKFNIFNCDEYKKLYHKNKIQFDPNDIKYPYNKRYLIEKNNDIIKLKLTD